MKLRVQVRNNNLFKQTQNFLAFFEDSFSSNSESLDLYAQNLQQLKQEFLSFSCGN